jgi:hypothetical protein
LSVIWLGSIIPEQVSILHDLSVLNLLFGISLVITGSIVLPSPTARRVLISGMAPSLGAGLAAGLYIILKQLRYDEVNGTADRDDTSPLMRTPLEIHHIAPGTYPLAEMDRESHKDANFVWEKSFRVLGLFIGIASLYPRVF